MKITSLLASMASALVAATGASAQMLGLGGLGLGGMGLGAMGGFGGMGGPFGAMGMGGMGGRFGGMGLGGPMGGFGGMGGMGGGVGGIQNMMRGLMDREGGFEGDLGLYGKGRGAGIKQGGGKDAKKEAKVEGGGESAGKKEKLAKMGRGGGGNWKSKFRTSVTGLGSGFDDITGRGHKGGLGVGGGLGRGGTRNTQEEDDEYLERRRRIQKRRRQQQIRRRKLQEAGIDVDGTDGVVEGVNTTPARKRKSKVPGIRRKKQQGQKAKADAKKVAEEKRAKTVDHNGRKGVRLEDLI